MIFIRKRIAPMIMLIALAAIFILLFGVKPVHADEKTIGGVHLDCDPGIWYILPEKDGNDNYVRLISYVNVSGEGIRTLVYGNLTYYGEDGIFRGLNANPIDPEEKYYLSLRISAEDGYVWPDKIMAAFHPVPLTDDLGLRLFFNSFRCTDARVENYLSDIYLHIPIGNDISSAKVSLSKDTFLYNGEKQVPSVTKAVLDEQILTSKNYDISFHDMSNQEVTPVEPGKYNIWLEGKGIYSGQVQVPFSIIRSNPMKVSGKTVTIKYKKLKKKAQTIQPGKAVIAEDAQGTVTFELISAKKGSKKIKLSKAKNYFKISVDSGKIKVKKKLKKGSYTLKVKVTASGNEDYTAANKTVTVKIKIK